MVGLPSIESREKILRTLLSKEKTENLDFHELGQITEGYSGSDLKVFVISNQNQQMLCIIMETNCLLKLLYKQNLCITAAYRPVRELIQQERLKDQVKELKDPLVHSLSMKFSTDIEISCWFRRGRRKKKQEKARKNQKKEKKQKLLRKELLL